MTNMINNVQSLKTIRATTNATTTTTKIVDIYTHDIDVDIDTTITRMKNTLYNVAIDLSTFTRDNATYFIFTSCDVQRTLSNVSLYHVDTNNVTTLIHRTKTSSIVALFEHIATMNIIDNDIDIDNVQKFDIDKIQRTIVNIRATKLRAYIDAKNTQQTTNE